MRNNGFKSQMPATTNAVTDKPAMPIFCQIGVVFTTAVVSAGAKNDTTASNGTMIKSSKSKIEIIF